MRLHDRNDPYREFTDWSDWMARETGTAPGSGFCIEYGNFFDQGIASDEEPLAKPKPKEEVSAV